MLIFLLVLVFCSATFLIFIFPLISHRADHDANIKIPANASAQMVEDSVARHLGDDFARRVMKLAALRHTDFSRRHGAYTIPQGANVIEAMRILTSGAQTPVKITINGFRDINLLTERVSAKMEFPTDSLRAALCDHSLLEQFGLTPTSALALFVNDTYEVYWSSSARDLIRKIGNNYTRLWSPENSKKAADLGLSPLDVVIIASITDEETNDRAEKATVGRLYINRLKINMPLQADPTIRFALNDFSIKRVRGAQLKVASPYNTYTNRGLPPGPIRTTDPATVEAILNSKPHDFLYMCAKEDFSGTHNFASSYDQHRQNAARYQDELDRRGITR
ncbi:MAG: endolytic transglycosylase MltG [Lepagella sp.]